MREREREREREGERRDKRNTFWRWFTKKKDIGTEAKKIAIKGGRSIMV